MGAKIELTVEEVPYIAEMIRERIHNFYYVPWDEERVDKTRHHRVLKSITAKFGMDFDQIVKEECSEEDIVRMQEILGEKVDG
jgi:hypothetical protein